MLLQVELVSPSRASFRVRAVGWPSGFEKGAVEDGHGLSSLQKYQASVSMNMEHPEGNLQTPSTQRRRATLTDVLGEVLAPFGIPGRSF